MLEWALSKNILKAIKVNFKSQKNAPDGFLIDNPMHNISHKRKKEDH